MNIVVIGPGALGSLFSARLAANGAQVSLLDHNAERAKALANHLTLRSNGKDRLIDLAITAEPSCLTTAELVLITVKSQHVSAVLNLIRQHASGALIIGLQNGISHLPHFNDNSGRLALGVTAQGATLLAPGHVRHGGDGPTLLGFLQPVAKSQQTRLAKAASLLSAAGIATEVVNDIESRLWQKLLINVGINGLTALYDCANGQLLDIAEARDRLVKLVEEGARVAKQRGIDVGSDPVDRCLQVCRATATNISSMRQDFRAGRPTEIMAINGALLTEAKKVGIAVPENELLVAEVVAISQGG